MKHGCYIAGILKGQLEFMVLTECFEIQVFHFMGSSPAIIPKYRYYIVLTKSVKCSALPADTSEYGYCIAIVANLVNHPAGTLKYGYHTAGILKSQIKFILLTDRLLENRSVEAGLTPPR